MLSKLPEQVDANFKSKPEVPESMTPFKFMALPEQVVVHMLHQMVHEYEHISLEASSEKIIRTWRPQESDTLFSLSLVSRYLGDLTKPFRFRVVHCFSIEIWREYIEFIRKTGYGSYLRTLVYTVFEPPLIGMNREDDSDDERTVLQFYSQEIPKGAFSQLDFLHIRTRYRIEGDFAVFLQGCPMIRHLSIACGILSVGQIPPDTISRLHSLRVAVYQYHEEDTLALKDATQFINTVLDGPSQESLRTLSINLTSSRIWARNSPTKVSWLIPEDAMMPSLESLEIFGRCVQADMDTFTRLSGALPNLTSLNIGMRDQRALDALAIGRWASLRQLDASYESNQGEKAFREGIVQCTPHLEHLGMSGLSITSMNQTLDLMSSPSVRLDFLTSLSIKFSLLKSAINMDISPISRAVSRLKNLETFALVGKAQLPVNFPSWTCDIGSLARALSGWQSHHLYFL